MVALLTWLDEPAVLLIKRIEREGDPWSGNVALPGGFASPGDVDLLDTALRELHEEVGVRLERSDVLGMLTPTSPLNRPEVKVAPYVAYLDQPPRLSLGMEVKEARWARLSEFKPSIVEVEVRGGKMLVEGFLVEDWVVWGLTARLLKELMSKLKYLVEVHRG